MSKRGEMKRYKRRLKYRAKRIPLGTEPLPNWLKRQFPKIYAQHVAHKMINGQKPPRPGIDEYKKKLMYAYGRGFQVTEEMVKLDTLKRSLVPNILVVPPNLKDKAEEILNTKPAAHPNCKSIVYNKMWNDIFSVNAFKNFDAIKVKLIDRENVPPVHPNCKSKIDNGFVNLA